MKIFFFLLFSVVAGDPPPPPPPILSFVSNCCLRDRTFYYVVRFHKLTLFLAATGGRKRTFKHINIHSKLFIR
jgi:hypothetical protein